MNNTYNELLARISKLDNSNSKLILDDSVRLEIPNFTKDIKDMALALKPWRKGPFHLNELFIDSEWRSFVKFNILKPHLNLKDKVVADVGCNNGYYMFKMLEFKPKSIVGFDPSELAFLQFSFINHFAKSDIKFEIAGVESLPSYGIKFDTIFCLGVLYHRSDPIKCLKELKSAMKQGGEVFIDTMYIERDDEMVLSPNGSYSKIPNISFIPSIKALQNWVKRAKFKSFEILATKDTDSFEQRKTKWIDSQSLEDFLDPNDSSKTIEGYPAPKRVYIRLT
ncbi:MULTISPECIES: tRNA 5-methoxyuridine(34)/uridine 5-oxyacetic acid(34) synthase CmoB [Campylobacter]|uniref:tRNA 5-methoxyuridine(34)/uridine 5-oxyacetic acid(34) synthase CmoB n=1 Tax=Campylobacter porcelli TaxID=1660073 RepID=A0ABU7M2B4_9BACT|nr:MULTISPECIES: tRNA 5-methoxyuridine(34)/uridine 5-oxyacetic acid(34) synthase CmoB [unclassified Campylobacter]MCR8695832.1 tRNA 5-methoxyuridine(34)/uridine 5-oxyacetic acid(34) synthase CmoB [Campylobacter sp. RM19073]MEE3704166.1 tRNA 5-methoxyuridine(34)/uridine 5-oxyacetic acid(34) synthase CmoB [Campylobacter sp. CX2-8023-23]MEE3743813.1 tRNA 5-methoxyuridine(34)/uridine 5-oxyacetic acid(34) synthase CmoB [Campylobacter sp. CX2-4855-23]MEE3776072.1 tRNA 5-methoxyuridine(34)/uridine 5-o